MRDSHWRNIFKWRQHGIIPRIFAWVKHKTRCYKVAIHQQNVALVHLVSILELSCYLALSLHTRITTLHQRTHRHVSPTRVNTLIPNIKSHVRNRTWTISMHTCYTCHVCHHHALLSIICTIQHRVHAHNSYTCTIPSTK